MLWRDPGAGHGPATFGLRLQKRAHRKPQGQFLTQERSRGKQAVASWGGPSEPPRVFLPVGVASPLGLSQPQVSACFPEHPRLHSVHAAVTLGAAACPPASWPLGPQRQRITLPRRQDSAWGSSLGRGDHISTWIPAQPRLGSGSPWTPVCLSWPLLLCLHRCGGTRPGAPEFLEETRIALAGHRAACSTGGGLLLSRPRTWSAYGDGA